MAAQVCCCYDLPYEHKTANLHGAIQNEPTHRKVVMGEKVDGRGEGYSTFILVEVCSLTAENVGL